jgi:DNA repair photolyase
MYKQTKELVMRTPRQVATELRRIAPHKSEDRYLHRWMTELAADLEAYAEQQYTYITVVGSVTSDEPLTHERHEQIVSEAINWAEERGLHLNLVTKLERE